MSRRRKKSPPPEKAEEAPAEGPAQTPAEAPEPSAPEEPKVEAPRPSPSRRKVTRSPGQDRAATLAILFVAAVLFGDALLILGLPSGADIVIPMAIPLGAGLLLALVLLRRIVGEPRPPTLLLVVGATGLLIVLGMLVFFVAHLFRPVVDPLVEGLPWDYAVALATLVVPLLGLGPGGEGLSLRLEARTVVTVAIPVGALLLTLLIPHPMLAVAGGLGLAAFLILAGALLREPRPILHPGSRETPRSSSAPDAPTRPSSMSTFAPEVTPERSALERYLRDGTPNGNTGRATSDSSFVEAAAASARPTPSPEPVAAVPAASPTPATIPPPAPRAPRAPATATARFRTGIERLDDLLKGGFPSHAQVGIIGPTFIGKETVLYAFLAEGLRRGESALVVAVSRSPADIAQELAPLLPELTDVEAQGRLLWIDAFAGEGASAGPEGTGEIKGPGDYTGILTAVAKSVQRLQARGAPFRVAYVSLSSSLTQHDERSGFAFVRNLLALLRPSDAATVYSIDRGVIDERQLEELQAALDGGVLFQRAGGKTSLSVLGLGDVATRQWVEYRRTERGFTLGSFALERIR